MKAAFAAPVLLLLAVLAPGQPAEQEKTYEPGIELPAGPGRELVATACTRCHDLKGLQAYKGYWNRQRWRAMVETMVKNGARLDEAQKTLVTDYLTSHYGPAQKEKSNDQY